MSNAAVVFTALVVVGVVEVAGTTHIPASENARADGLSRARTPGQLGLAGLPFVDLNQDPTALEIRQLCNPALGVDSDEDFVAHWRQSNDVALSLL